MSACSVRTTDTQQHAKNSERAHSCDAASYDRSAFIRLTTKDRHIQSCGLRPQMKNVTRSHVQVLDSDKEVGAIWTGQTHLIAHVDQADLFGIILKEGEPTLLDLQ